MEEQDILEFISSQLINLNGDNSIIGLIEIQEEEIKQFLNGRDEKDLSIEELQTLEKMRKKLEKDTNRRNELETLQNKYDDLSGTSVVSETFTKIDTINKVFSEREKRHLGRQVIVSTSEPDVRYVISREANVDLSIPSGKDIRRENSANASVLIGIDNPVGRVKGDGLEVMKFIISLQAAIETGKRYGEEVATQEQMITAYDLLEKMMEIARKEYDYSEEFEKNTLGEIKPANTEDKLTKQLESEATENRSANPVSKNDGGSKIDSLRSELIEKLKEYHILRKYSDEILVDNDLSIEEYEKFDSILADYLNQDLEEETKKKYEKLMEAILSNSENYFAFVNEMDSEGKFNESTIFEYLSKLNLDEIERIGGESTIRIGIDLIQDLLLREKKLCEFIGETYNKVIEERDDNVRHGDRRVMVSSEGDGIIKAVSHEKNGTAETARQDDETIEPVTQDDGTIEPVTQDNGTIEPVTQDNGTIEPVTQDNGTIEPATQDDGTIEPETNEGEETIESTEQEGDRTINSEMENTERATESVRLGLIGSIFATILKLLKFLTQKIRPLYSFFSGIEDSLYASAEPALLNSGDIKDKKKGMFSWLKGISSEIDDVEQLSKNIKYIFENRKNPMFKEIYSKESKDLIKEFKGLRSRKGQKKVIKMMIKEDIPEVLDDNADTVISYNTLKTFVEKAKEDGIIPNSADFRDIDIKEICELIYQQNAATEKENNFVYMSTIKDIVKDKEEFNPIRDVYIEELIKVSTELDALSPFERMARISELMQDENVAVLLPGKNYSNIALLRTFNRVDEEIRKHFSDVNLDDINRNFVLAKAIDANIKIVDDNGMPLDFEEVIGKLREYQEKAENQMRLLEISIVVMMRM